LPTTKKRRSARTAEHDGVTALDVILHFKHIGIATLLEAKIVELSVST